MTEKIAKWAALGALLVFFGKALGFTLHEIAEIFHASGHDKSPCPKVLEIIRQHIDENRRALGELRALQRRMESAAAQWGDMI